MICETQYGKQTIRFRLERRKVKSLAIRVQPAGLIEVVAPNSADDQEICRRVARRGRWVLKQQRAFTDLFKRAANPQMRNGESVRYLGRQYRLRIRRGEAEGAKLTRNTLEVSLSAQSRSERALILIERWFAEHARRKLTERYEHCVKLVRPFGVRGGLFTLRRMQRRWGSCSASGRVLLNPALVKAPVDCIDYVIIHELCHLRCHHHRPQFYKLLSRILPDWKRRKAKLETSFA